MPVTYEYHCDCEQPTIISTDIDKRDDPRTCPTCQAQLRRVYSSIGIVFKGTGWAGKEK
jgi:putative FmdB family regulatory protein